MKPARFYIPVTVLLAVAVLVSECMAGVNTPPTAGVRIALASVWPVIFYCIATNTPTPWANNILMGLVFTAVTPYVFDSVTYGWGSHPLTALMIGSVTTALMVVSLSYSVALSLWNGTRNREEKPGGSKETP